VWELTGDDHNYDASDNGLDSRASSRFAHDDNDDAHGWRLLKAQSPSRCVRCNHGPAWHAVASAKEAGPP